MARSRLRSGQHVRTSARLLAGMGAWALALGSPTLALAAGGEGGGGLIELNRTLLVQVINFLVLLALLYVVAYKPLVGTLKARSTAIKQQLAEAEAARQQAQQQLAEFEARLQAAHAEAQALRDRALREAAETRERLTAEARHEAAQLLEAARAQIEQDVRRAKAELRTQVGGLAVEIAERLVRRSLRDEDHRRIVEEALGRMDTP